MFFFNLEYPVSVTSHGFPILHIVSSCLWAATVEAQDIWWNLCLSLHHCSCWSSILVALPVFLSFECSCDSYVTVLMPDGRVLMELLFSVLMASGDVVAKWIVCRILIRMSWDLVSVLPVGYVTSLGKVCTPCLPLSGEDGHPQADICPRHATDHSVVPQWPVGVVGLRFFMAIPSI